MQSFVYNALPGRVIFGSGTISTLKSEIERAGCKRALLLSTPEQSASLKNIAASIGALAAGIFAQAAMHTPTDVTERALQAAKESNADCTIAFGGGSSTGLGKAIALRTDLTQIAIPTTYAGSEMTPIIGETEGGRKTTQRSMKVLPEIVIYDVDFTLTLPQRLSVTSCTNAIAHAVEALYAQDRNPVISMMAEQAIAAMGRALPAIVADPKNREARADALYGAWLCGVCLGSVGMALPLGVMAVVFATAGVGADGRPVLTRGAAVAGLTAANLYIVAFGVSWGPVMWVLLGEMFPNRLRGSALAVSGATNWTANFAVTLTFLPLLNAAGLAGAYALYSMAAVLSLPFVWAAVRETKGKTLEQM